MIVIIIGGILGFILVNAALKKGDLSDPPPRGIKICLKILGIIMGALIGVLISVLFGATLPKSYTYARTIDLTPIHEESFIARIETVSETDRYVFLKKDANDQTKIGVVSTTIADVYRGTRNNGIIKVYESSSKRSPLLLWPTVSASPRYEIFIPENSKILTSK